MIKIIMADVKQEKKPLLLARVAFFWGGYLAILWLTSLVKAKLPPQWGQLAWGVTSCAMLLPLTALFLRMDHRRADEIELNLNRTSCLRVVLGLLIGFAVFGLQSYLLFASLQARFCLCGLRKSGDVWDCGFRSCAATLALSAMEEIGFRGYPLRTLVRGFGLWPAQGIVAVAFGLCHMAFGWPLGSILLGVVPSALLFGMAAIASRGLAIPIGLHAGLKSGRQDSMNGNGGWELWTLKMDDRVGAAVARTSPIIGATVVILAMIVFWWWSRFRAGPS